MRAKFEVGAAHCRVCTDSIGCVLSANVRIGSHAQPAGQRRRGPLLDGHVQQPRQRDHDRHDAGQQQPARHPAAAEFEQDEADVLVDQVQRVGEPAEERHPGHPARLQLVRGDQREQREHADHHPADHVRREVRAVLLALLPREVDRVVPGGARRDDQWHRVPLVPTLPGDQRAEDPADEVRRPVRHQQAVQEHRQRRHGGVPDRDRQPADREAEHPVVRHADHAQTQDEQVELQLDQERPVHAVDQAHVEQARGHRQVVQVLLGRDAEPSTRIQHDRHSGQRAGHPERRVEPADPGRHERAGPLLPRAVQDHEAADHEEEVDAEGAVAEHAAGVGEAGVGEDRSLDARAEAVVVEHHGDGGHEAEQVHLVIAPAAGGGLPRRLFGCLRRCRRVEDLGAGGRGFGGGGRVEGRGGRGGMEAVGIAAARGWADVLL
jgi:hypothetical protein